MGLVQGRSPATVIALMVFPVPTGSRTCIGPEGLHHLPARRGAAARPRPPWPRVLLMHMLAGRSADAGPRGQGGASLQGDGELLPLFLWPHPSLSLVLVFLSKPSGAWCRSAYKYLPGYYSAGLVSVWRLVRLGLRLSPQDFGAAGASPCAVLAGCSGPPTELRLPPRMGSGLPAPSPTPGAHSQGASHGSSHLQEAIQLDGEIFFALLRRPPHWHTAPATAAMIPCSAMTEWFMHLRPHPALGFSAAPGSGICSSVKVLL